MGRCVIIGGADIGKYDVIKTYLKEDDFVIACDCGLRHLSPLGIEADLVIGDFDSHEKPDSCRDIIVLPHMKDDTDSVYAGKEALRRGYKDILLAGVLGNRFDHSMVNIYLLLLLAKAGARAVAVDDYSEFEMILPGMDGQVADRYPYFSLLAITGKASGITITDALYELADGTISPEYQYATSNEPLPGKTARIQVREGDLLLIRDR